LVNFDIVLYNEMKDFLDDIETLANRWKEIDRVTPHMSQPRTKKGKGRRRAKQCGAINGWYTPGAGTHT
jgi:hypothetical protein